MTGYFQVLPYQALKLAQMTLQKSTQFVNNVKNKEKNTEFSIRIQHRNSNMVRIHAF